MMRYRAGDYDVAAMGWSADYVNPMSFLPLLYTGDVSNNVFYSNTDYDAVVDQIKVEKDPAKFAELVMQADEIASNEYPVLPLYYKSNSYPVKGLCTGCLYDIFFQPVLQERIRFLHTNGEILCAARSRRRASGIWFLTCTLNWLRLR